MSGSVLILTGPPGAGKSTISDILARESTRPSVHLHTDDFYDRYIKSGYVLPWLPEAQKQNETVTNIIAAAASAYAAGGYFTIIDGIVGPWFLEPYRTAAREKNVLLDYVVLRPASADVAWKRVEARQTHGLKAEGPLRDIYRQFAALGEFEKHVFDSSVCTEDKTASQLRMAVGSGKFRLN
jgi:adenylate kinase family enzyme